MGVTEYLLDTNIVSKLLTGDVDLKSSLTGKKVCISTIIYIELIQGAIKKHYRESLKKRISTIHCYPLTPEISNLGIELIDKYSASEGLFLPDGLIAATAIEHELTLVTFNIKDFKFIKGLTVIES